MRSGRLRHRITIQAVSETKNSHHEMVKSWGNIPSNPIVWAEVEALGGKEFLEAHKLNAEHNVRIHIRPRNDLDSTMRVLWGDRVYQLDYVPPYHPKKTMTLLAHETK